MTAYRLTVHRDLGTSYGLPEYPDVPAVSQAAFGLLATRDWRDEAPSATWHGGQCSDCEAPLGRALIGGSTKAVAELLPLLRWCAANTRNTDVCALEET